MKEKTKITTQEEVLKYNEFSIDWISKYIVNNKSYICEYIDGGNLHLK